MPTPLLELRNIGKIYVSEGNVAVGIRGVNLSFDRGEFVAVTGKSGSGKSTLLNVLSGMDTYEEGELLICGEPTSHYLQSDWEEYRKQYISFIFQEYNIIESFTVLQNVELALMNISDRRARRAHALELLRRVGLEKFIHHKGSKLSGGQKQRTVIARALAKDSPIILADEPTGNLDSQTSEEIISLLREVSRDKLVVVVTHNFEQVEHCATRHIRIFDGAVESDQVISKPAPVPTEAPPPEATEPRKPFARHREQLRNGLTLGRVRFGAMPKLSLFLCMLMIVTALVLTVVTSLSSSAERLFDKNYMFTHMQGRTVIARADGGIMTADELAKLAATVGAERTVRYDYLMDQTVTLFLGKNWQEDGLHYLNFRFAYANGVTPDGGRLPETANEVLLELPIFMKSSYGAGEEFEPFVLSSDTSYNGGVLSNTNYTVTGVRYFYDNTRNSRMLFTEEGYRTATAAVFFQKQQYNFSVSVGLKSSQPGNEFSREYRLEGGGIIVDFGMEPGTYTLASLVNGDTVYDAANVSADVSLTGTFVSYRKNQYGYRTGYADDFRGSGYGQRSDVNMDFSGYRLVTSVSKETAVLLRQTYNEMALIIAPDILTSFVENEYFTKAYTQASLFFDSDREAHAKVDELREAGYVAVPSDETVDEDVLERLEKVITNGFLLVGWVLAVVFIALFLGLCTSHAMNASRGDIAIMRSMGIPTPVVRISIYVQTLTALIPAILVTAVACTVVYSLPQTNELFSFLHAREYILLALLLVAVALRLSRRYVRKMFSQSVKKTLKGGNKA